MRLFLIAITILFSINCYAISNNSINSIDGSFTGTVTANIISVGTLNATIISGSIFPANVVTQNYFNAVSINNTVSANSFFSGNSLQLNASSAYTSPTRSFGVTVTPNATRSTFVIAIVELNCSSGQSQTVDPLVNNASVGAISNNLTITGVLVGGTSIIRQQINFFVPPNQNYRLNNSGSGSATLISTRELIL